MSSFFNTAKSINPVSSLTKLALAIGISGMLLSGCQSLPHTTATDPVSKIQSTDQSTTKPTTTSSNLTMDLSGRHEYKLDNGLKVIIKEDHRAPVVMTQLWYKVGSSDEPSDKGGISHLLEHMMFKGTEQISGTDFERLTAKYGGVNNAFTSYDYTGYYELFPANRLSLALELEADRMTNLQFDPAAFAKEHQVVMEERRQRTDDDPIAKAYEAFRLQALPDSPKGESVIGPMAELESITLPDLKAWYKQWYVPNNATLVIVGDVNPDAALTQVKRYFADIPKRVLPKRASVRQSGFRGYEQTTTKQAVKVPMLIMAYNVPSLWSTIDNDDHQATQSHTVNNKSPKTQSLAQRKDTFALSLAQAVLDGGLSSRLERRLVREQGLLASVGTSYDLLERGDGLFLIQATPREGVSLEQVQNAILTEIEKLKTDPIAADEITRAKTNTMTGLIYAQDSMEGQAQMIGSLQSIGIDDTLLAKLPAELDQVSVSDIQKAAKTYLVKDNLSVMNVEPE